MKNIILFILTALVAVSAYAQEQNKREPNRQTAVRYALNDSTEYVWAGIGLIDPSAKLGQVNRSLRLHTALSLGIPLSAPDALSVSFPQLLQALHSPAVFEQLFENLGGEYFPGDPDATAVAAYTLRGAGRPMPGVRLGLGLGRRLELRAGAQYYTMSWSGAFPVTVFSHNQSAPTKRMGALKAETSGVLTEVDAAYFLTGGRLQPFIRAGVRAQFPLERASEAELAGVALPLAIDVPGTQASPFGAAGLRLRLGENAFVEAVCAGGRLPGRTPGLSLEFSGGWMF